MATDGGPTFITSLESLNQRIVQIEREIGFVPCADSPLGQGFGLKRLPDLGEAHDYLDIRVASLEDRMDDVIACMNPPPKTTLKRRVKAWIISWVAGL